jgi:hypothetical protein
MRENKPAVALRAREQQQAGEKNERLREHRIGHLRFQACGDWDWRGRIVFAIGFIAGAVRIRDACRRDSRKDDLENRGRNSPPNNAKVSIGKIRSSI